MQTLINRYFLIIFLFSYTLHGCTICTIYSPLTQVSIKIDADDKKIKTLNITWVLTKEFTEQLEQIYDRNQNNYLDKRELIPVEESILDYIEDKNYLTHISYDKLIDIKNSNEVIIKSKKTYIKNSLLHFNYVIDLNYDVIKDNALYISVEDDEKYFILVLSKDNVKFNAPFEYQELINEKSVVFNIDVKIQENKKMDDKEESQNKMPDIKTEVKKEDNSLLSNFSKKVKEYLLKIENGDDYALFVLLGISFIYGVLHALGPGHGKSLAFSYFAANKSSFLKAFWISQLSAFVHIIGALILVVISVFLLQSVLNNFVNDSVEILTKLSSVMIIMLAIYILYNKLNNKNCSCSSCTPSSKPTWSTKLPQNRTKLKTNFMKKDLYFVITAGLIPCPGTVVLFIYAFILKTYFAVILASIFISIGMGLVIFISSFFGVALHNVSERSHKITNIIEILAPVFMIILAILLFLNANII